MFSMLLAIIYMAFISLGLPDSLLGSGWPAMQVELEAPLSSAGIITMIISLGTIVSSLMADRLSKRFSAGLITAVSVGLTAAALFGFSVSNSFLLLCVFAIPYGLGAGAVDAVLNNYVALHYSSRHMSWLHAFWGVGVSISPYVMSTCLSLKLGWQMGYRSISIIQIVLTVILFLSVPMWKKSGSQEEGVQSSAPLTIRRAVKIKGVVFVLITFFAYCSFESTAGLWASSYLVGFRNVDVNTAASFTALFYLGETVGRFLNGFVADRFGDKTMIRVGIIVMLIGTAMILLPLNTYVVCLIGLVVIGLGAAPVYPCVIHSTPTNFGKENSQGLVGIQMASAYVGTTLMPLLFGVIADGISVALFPLYLGILAVIMLVMSERLNKAVK